ncbi:MAG: hypothetical protein GWP10_03260 [Nitrospiraceae bacterium]|nr:hypothetical protein [Nitrospiraceae bacterium]
MKGFKDSMLGLIRKNAGSWIIKFILGLLVLVFALWGVGSYRSQKASILAKVNGDKILMESYHRAYNNIMNRYRQMFKGQIPEGLLSRLNIKQQAADSLIDKVLICQAAKKQGIRVTDKEIQGLILSIPAFKRNGAFDQRLYERALREERITPAAFETQVREQLLADKVRTLLCSGLAVTDAEAKQHYMYENEEVNLAYVAVDPSEYETEVNATDKAIGSWYKAHKEKYMTEPQIRLRYLAFNEADVKMAANVTDQEVKAYYQDHKNEYKVKERRRARHILLKVPRNADKKKVKEIQKKAEKIYKKIKKGGSFAALAKKYSEDPGSAKKGGDLGFFTRGMMIKPFEDAVFSMKPGEVSRPIRSPFGWHIIKLEKIEPARLKPLAEVKNSIVTRLRTKKAETQIWDRANAAYDKIIQLGSLNSYAKRHGLKLETTKLFTQKRPPAVIGTNPDLLKAVFSLNTGELSSLLQVPQGILVAEVLEKKLPYVPPLKEIKAQVKRDYIQERAKELCQIEAKGLLETAKKKGLEAACKNKKLKIQETGFFKRTDRTVKGLPISVIRTGLSLYAGKVYPDKVTESRGEFYVLAFKGKKDTDAAGFSTQKKAIIKRILRHKRQTVFSDWLKDLRAKASIEMVTKI